MSVQKIIQEAVNENPLGLKEALEEELRARVSEAIAVKMEATDTQMGTIAVTSDEERKKLAQLYRDKKTTKNEEVELDEADAVVTHKWYSIKHWKDGSRHFDNLDDRLRGHTYKHAALGNTAKNRPDHHIGIPVKASSAIAYMDKHAKPIS
jgi:hypothetical protein